jgi:hypothetical protein
LGHARKKTGVQERDARCNDGGVWKIPVLANPGEGDADGISSCRGRVRIEDAAQNDGGGDVMKLFLPL